MLIKIRTAALAATLAAFATPAFAHVGLHDQGGFAYGFMHPMSGLDHVCAMVAVGMLAAQLGGRALWLLPGAFVGMMIVGGVLGFEGVGLPLVEHGVGLSVIVLGALVALGVRMPTAIAMGLVGLFAVFHGHAHGTELPKGIEPAEFAEGFILATALLHVGGIALGLALIRLAAAPREWAARIVGAVMALFGVSLLAQ